MKSDLPFFLIKMHFSRNKAHTLQPKTQGTSSRSIGLKSFYRCQGKAAFRTPKLIPNLAHPQLLNECTPSNHPTHRHDPSTSHAKHHLGPQYNNGEGRGEGGRGEKIAFTLRLEADRLPPESGDMAMFGRRMMTRTTMAERRGSVAGGLQVG
ncbi:hypothetical protein L210DRAFT_63904 [Boletus edulis BED1]|uniref:Uncharacterized protein n=1 Tax=Boletus edulis BED1 TaxID=1328754 RepID=A0AAD4BTQ7_BOLED|nr:hypothetical protein L210DRAFT_63904 [Boletus edulis BED1]